MSQADVQDLHERQQPRIDVEHDFGSDTTDDRTDAQKEADKQLAERLSALIEDANSRVVPLCRMIRKVIMTLVGHSIAC